jgi:hypothetical protein
MSTILPLPRPPHTLNCYAMSRESYPFTTHVMPVGHVGHHSTSSAFSSSANADEDWTQISDLAERRRIQNRIAQRNYRKFSSILILGKNITANVHIRQETQETP